MKVHFTSPYLLNPQHKITVDLVGVGGTGSQVLTNLARLNVTLIGLGHPGLFVRCWDGDIVTQANIGRQLFSPADLGHNKAVVLVTRVNGFFGFDWKAMATEYNMLSGRGNILITCVDTAAARIQMHIDLKKVKASNEPQSKGLYWLDLGNGQKTGQCILGTIGIVSQPKKSAFQTVGKLKNIVEFLPGMKNIKEEDQGPSCSLADAINKQDLFINSTLAQFGVNLLWKLFRDGCINFQGCYINLQTFNVNPIKIR